MSMIAVPISDNISRMFREIKVSGVRDPSDHITMFYMGDEFPINKIIKSIEPIFEITKSQKPFLVSCEEIISFPEGKKGFPVVGKIESDELKKLRNKIKKALDKNKIEYDNKFPKYNPHITLSYSEEEQSFKIPKIEFLINEIAFFGGDEDKERIYISFPLSLNKIKKSAEYIELLTDSFRRISRI